MEQELLDKALTFIIDGYTDEGKFECPFTFNCEYYECEKCTVKSDVCDILGIE